MKYLLISLLFLSCTDKPAENPPSAPDYGCGAGNICIINAVEE